jgi:NAD(P)-dependent dehydrogenase (short-subunit alcohol dehydrogenase family)
VVAISSNSATVMADVDGPAVALCLDGDEGGARARLTECGGFTPYPTSKLALARWIRRSATSRRYLGAGIRLNAIAPGPVDTPMTASMAAWVLDLGDVYPVPIGRMARTDEISSVLSFLLSPASSYVVGAFLPVDGGGEAAARADEWPLARS